MEDETEEIRKSLHEEWRGGGQLRTIQKREKETNT